MKSITHGFEASLFHPDFGGEPIAGQVLIGRTELQFQSEAVSFAIPLARLDVEFEDGGKGIFLSDPSRPDASIFTLNQSILRHAVIRSRPGVAAVLGRRELTRALRLTLYFAVGCLLAVWLGSVAVSAMTRAIAARIPMEWEKKLGGDEIENLRQSGRLLDDSNDIAQLTFLAGPLIQALPEGRRDLKFYILDDPDPNACALPGGHVIVNTGLLQLLDQPEEVLGVLAHELAHQTKRHAMRRCIAATGPVVIFGVFLHSNGRMGNLLTLGSGLMVYQGFSQDYEMEADDLGWSYLVKANIDPRGMIGAFRKFQDLEKKERLRGFGPQALRSHPTTAKRIARLENKWEKLGRKSDFVTLAPVHWIFKNEIKN